MDSFKNSHYFGSEDGQIHKIDFNNTISKVYKIHDDSIVCIKIIAEKYLLTSSNDNTMSIVDLISDNCIYKEYNDNVTFSIIENLFTFNFID
jgi:WD40 repeat protein